MFITESIIGFSFPRKAKIRQTALGLEETLGSFMALPLQILPVPEDAPQDIPRAFGNSQGGHSTLTLTQVTANFKTIYDGNFNTEWDLCFDYLTEKVKLLFPFVNEIANGEILNFGIVLKIIYRSNIGESAHRIVKTIIKSNNLPSELDELSLKTTFYQNEKYYVNFLIESLRNYATSQVGDRDDIQILSKSPIAEALQFSIDVNDRYIGNFSSDYFTSEETSKEIMQIVSNIVRIRLEKIYSDGDWS